MTNETEAPERIWIGKAYGNDTGVDWSEIRVFQTDVAYNRADLSDAKDKRIAELEALVHKLASDPDYTAAYAAGVADQKATLAELEAKLALADVLATECERAFDDVDGTGTQEFYLALYTYTDSRATLAKLTTNPNVQERTKP
jgi:dGTP triphosphohydrolase